MNAAANSSEAMTPAEGDILAGKYRVAKILGKGGMGVVVAAVHIQLAQRVAIKYLFQPDNKEIVARFLREARAAVRLRSEHVARVIDVGELENGAPYMVMEYLEGDDLHGHLKKNGQLPIQEAVQYLLQTCEAIAEAHANGIVHRDLKPANLFLTTTPDGARSVKVLDFGISKTTDNEGEGDGMALTKTSMVLGSPLYMSPEQIKSSKDVDARSDIWSLGIILFQLLCGKVPFSTNTFSELILKVNLDPPSPTSSFRSDIPPGLEATILRCLEKKRENRFQNVAELAWALVDYGPPTARLAAEKCARVLEASGATVTMPEGVTRGATAPGFATSTQNTSTQNTSAQAAQTNLITSSVTKEAVATTVATEPATTKSKKNLVIGLCVVGLVLGVAGAMVLRGPSPSTPADTHSAIAAPLSSAPPVPPKETPTVSPVAAPVVTGSDVSPPASALGSASSTPATKRPAPGPTTKKPSGNNPLEMSPY